MRWLGSGHGLQCRRIRDPIRAPRAAPAAPPRTSPPTTNGTGCGHGSSKWHKPSPVTAPRNPSTAPPRTAPSSEYVCRPRWLCGEILARSDGPGDGRAGCSTVTVRPENHEGWIRCARRDGARRTRLAAAKVGRRRYLTMASCAGCLTDRVQPRRGQSRQHLAQHGCCFKIESGAAAASRASRHESPTAHAHPHWLCRRSCRAHEVHRFHSPPSHRPATDRASCGPDSGWRRDPGRAQRTANCTARR